MKDRQNKKKTLLVLGWKTYKEKNKNHTLANQQQFNTLNLQ